MNSLRLVWSLIRVPKLFASLLLFPLLVSVLIVLVQLVFTAVFIEISQQDAEGARKTMMKIEENNVVRRLLYGNGARLPEIRVCKWKDVETAGGRLKEAPSSPECAPDVLDVAVQTGDPAGFDVSDYAELFNGNFERLHVCRRCHPDTVVVAHEEERGTNSYSIWSIALLSITGETVGFRERYVNSLEKRERSNQLLGSRRFHSSGLRHPVSLEEIQVAVAVVLNVTSLVIMGLWLALKAHRKVLDYFAKNGALLPLVAASGKGTFYLSIWILTLLRVGLFFIASIPLCYFLFTETLRDDTALNLFSGDIYPALWWLPAMFASFSLATIVASIADLKERHTLLSSLYRYVPLVFCSLGALSWALSFLLRNESAGLFREILTALPVVGLAPVLVAPMIVPRLWTLIVHTILSTAVIIMLLKRNAKWFAAHLEEL